MNEKFLYFIWENTYFNQFELETTQGLPLQILSPGKRNYYQGPDYFDAQLSLDSLNWFGKVEIHVKSSDWLVHQHQNDIGYDAVMLHVVYQHDMDIYRSDGTPIPTLELRGRIKLSLLQKFEELQNNPSTVPCQNELSEVPRVKVIGCLEQKLYERLNEKQASVLSLVETLEGNWKNSFFKLLINGLGSKVNEKGFSQLGNILDYSFFGKHADNIQSVEALLFGVAGFLSSPSSVYAKMLSREYEFLKTKFVLKNEVDISLWRFSGVRPPNYPTFRLAQLSQIFLRFEEVFNLATSTKQSIKQWEALLKFDTTDFWSYHYHFSKKTTPHPTEIGQWAIHNYIINSIVPFVFAYGVYLESEELKYKSLELLQELPIENNKITRLFHPIKNVVTHAGDTQALIRLFKNYCRTKKCLDCSIGLDILKRRNFI